MPLSNSSVRLVTRAVISDILLWIWVWIWPDWEHWQACPIWKWSKSQIKHNYSQTSRQGEDERRWQTRGELFVMEAHVYDIRRHCASRCLWGCHPWRVIYRDPATFVFTCWKADKIRKCRYPFLGAAGLRDISLDPITPGSPALSCWRMTEADLSYGIVKDFQILINYTLVMN